MEMIEKVIREGKQAVFLIPEIALTYQTVMRFYQRFGDRVSIMHSRLSDGEKYDQMMRAKNGEIDVMIGPRSALFTPFEKLGLIVIDEEHEATYKSEQIPRYHARETARRRAEMEGASVVLGSATPSVDSYYKALHGEYVLLELKCRATGQQLPEMYTVDLREELKSGNRSIISDRLRTLMSDRLKRENRLFYLSTAGDMQGLFPVGPAATWQSVRTVTWRCLRIKMENWCVTIVVMKNRCIQVVPNAGRDTSEALEREHSR